MRPRHLLPALQPSMVASFPSDWWASRGYLGLTRSQSKWGHEKLAQLRGLLLHMDSTYKCTDIALTGSSRRDSTLMSCGTPSFKPCHVSFIVIVGRSSGTTKTFHVFTNSIQLRHMPARIGSESRSHCTPTSTGMLTFQRATHQPHAHHLVECTVFPLGTGQMLKKSWQLACTLASRVAGFGLSLASGWPSVCCHLSCAGVSCFHEIWHFDILTTYEICLASLQSIPLPWDETWWNFLQTKFLYPGIPASGSGGTGLRWNQVELQPC